jgi:hypothetical protein
LEPAAPVVVVVVMPANFVLTLLSDVAALLAEVDADEALLDAFVALVAA